MGEGSGIDTDIVRRQAAKQLYGLFVAIKQADVIAVYEGHQIAGRGRQPGVARCGCATVLLAPDQPDAGIAQCRNRSTDIIGRTVIDHQYLKVLVTLPTDTAH